LDKWEVKQYRVLKDKLEDWKGKERLKHLQDTAAKLKAEPEKSNKAGE
jgi:hypothetical protein